MKNKYVAIFGVGALIGVIICDWYIEHLLRKQVRSLERGNEFKQEIIDMQSGIIDVQDKIIEELKKMKNVTILNLDLDFEKKLTK